MALKNRLILEFVVMRRLFMLVILVGTTLAGLMAVFFMVPKSHLLSSISPEQEVNVTDSPDVTDSPKPARGLIVDTPSCRIPDVDPFDSSVIKLIKPRGKIVCSRKPSITYEDGTMLRINWTRVKNIHKGNFSHCKYQPILRGDKMSDFYFVYGPVKNMTKDVEIHDNFLKVQCVNKANVGFYTNFHSFVIPDNVTEKRCEENHQKHISKNKPKEVMNVLMIGIDGVSRLNFIRQMPKTRKYLLNDLEAIEMFGYTKVADNTFVNIVPLTAGKFVHELPWGKEHKQTFDKYGFIWKNFSSNGYRTFYAEDAPDIAIFHYLKRGFRQPPTDYYNRVMSIALKGHKSVWNTWGNCVNDRLETEIVLKQTRDFVCRYRHKPHFVFTFITRMSHDGINQAGAGDDPHSRYLQKLHKEGLLNNTIFIYFSDHGARFGSIRNTFIGKLEERLPLFYLVLPGWFKKKYPQILKNLKVNAHRLTTPFDVYETLKHIVFFNGKVEMGNVSKRGISLFNEVPRDRSCDDAGILPHWCVCLERQQLQVSSKLVKDAAQYIVMHINNMLHNHRNVCQTLKYIEITRPVRLGANEKLLQYMKSSLIQFVLKTKPGNALFESTVRFDKKTGKYALVGDISRINKYGEQSHCVKDFILKKYCYCKVQH